MQRVAPKKRWPIPVIVVIVLAVVILVLAAAYCGLCKWVQDNGRLLPGAQAEDDTGAVVLELGGLTREDALSQMEQYMDGHLE